MREIICSTGEVVDDYDDYLKTRHWRRFKEKYAKKYVKQCTWCDEKENIHLHHMTYERLGNETFKDVIHLCRACHSKVHKLENEDTNSLGEFVIKINKLKPVKADCGNCFHNKRNNVCSYYKISNPQRKKCKFFYFLDRSVPEEDQIKWARRATQKQELITLNKISDLRKITLKDLNSKLNEELTLKMLQQTYEKNPTKMLDFSEDGFTLKILTFYLTLSVRVMWKSGEVEEFEIKN
ncbi:hypothetical protein CR194_05215 [Salipaludibacillus keqinensis]|uniref:HNH endonuclease n=1 Tax=Salipaludibacillus keqinensis TaxID=2045207 RepID=A0A323TLT3_9BACI|nr:hypothetical protein [Salipaludibacillus keqinensis]PYZ94924.1 hypothetical protein CR194_05215 [Salipaludibacillus keqinensis]